MSDPVEKPCLKEAVADDLKIRVGDDNAEEFSNEADPEPAGETAKKTQATGVIDPPSKEESKAGNPSSEERAKKPRFEANSSEGAANFRRNEYLGLMRHRAILAGCCVVAGIVMLMSTMDLKKLLTQPMNIDSNLHLSTPVPEPEIPSNMNWVEESWQHNRKFSEGLAPVSQTTWDGDKIGFVDKSGKVVITPQFSEVGDFHEGLASARPYYSKEKFQNQNEEEPGPRDSKLPKWGYIDKTGRWVIPPQFESPGVFKNGVAPVLFPSDGGNQSIAALIDPLGKIIFQTNSYQIPNLIGEVYCVQQSAGQKGLVDLKGNWVIPPHYDLIEAFSDESNKFVYPYANVFNTNVQQLNGEAPELYFKVGKDGLVGVANAAGKILIPPRYFDILAFNNGVATFGEHGRVGFVDVNGRVIMPADFTSASPYDDIIVVMDAGKYRVLDKTGKDIPGLSIDAPIYAGGANGWLSEGRAGFYKNGKVGYLNNKGEIVIPPKFMMGSVFKNGVATVWDGSFWRIIDRNGNFALPDRFLKISPFATAEGGDGGSGGGGGDELLAGGAGSGGGSASGSSGSGGGSGSGLISGNGFVAAGGAGGGFVIAKSHYILAAETPGPLSMLTHAKEISDFEQAMQAWETQLEVPEKARAHAPKKPKHREYD